MAEFPLTLDCGAENATIYGPSYQNLLNAYYCGENFLAVTSDEKSAQSFLNSSSSEDHLPLKISCGKGSSVTINNGTTADEYVTAYDCGKVEYAAINTSAAPARLKHHGKLTLMSYVFAILMLSGFACS
ncbi:unnamed protein product [Kuraishia capsulata CBS 1993]|uniref:Uncharacterized protein n=1 Tax=Kuraishia capsulata CBS 1993 TaxID=1382522 RepID=W6MMT1_9ASCO|nr:uncharacterized protein KUCA_T00003904001 [Kuraishia capsulata CBS 1993]CDK27924.1 unnamed protein product [Kuraishia capsulata CBS 1993]